MPTARTVRLVLVVKNGSETYNLIRQNPAKVDSSRASFIILLSPIALSIAGSRLKRPPIGTDRLMSSLGTLGLAAVMLVSTLIRDESNSRLGRCRNL